MNHQLIKVDKKNLRSEERSRSIINGVLLANLFLIVVIISFFVGYLALNNQTAADGFMMRDLEKQIVVLRDQGKRLDLQIIAMQAMNNVGQQAGKLGFVPVGQLEYISGGPAAVAVK
jgi:hypothetical protein